MSGHLLNGVKQSLGDVPGIALANKDDLASEWEVTDEDIAKLEESIPVIRTSAKTGEKVDQAFSQLARGMLETSQGAGISETTGPLPSSGAPGRPARIVTRSDSEMLAHILHDLDVLVLKRDGRR